MRKSDGYTAMEMLVAVAVTAVVLALIVIAARTYTIRKQVTDGVEAARRWGAVVETRFRVDGRVPRTWHDVGPQIEVPSTEYVEKLLLVNGRIDVVFGRDADRVISGHQLSLTPYQTADQQI